jgi:hypothetical protein
MSMTAPVGSATRAAWNATAVAQLAPRVTNAIEAESSKRMIVSHGFVLRPPFRCTPAILSPARGRGKSAGGPGEEARAKIAEAQKSCPHQSLPGRRSPRRGNALVLGMKDAAAG